MNAHINAHYDFELEIDRSITLPDGQRHRIANVALSIDGFPKKKFDVA
jgi:hypothetical protein